MSPTREYAGATSIEGKVLGSIPGCSLARESPVCSLDDLAKVTSHGSALTSGPREVSRDVGRQDAVWSQRKKSPGVTGSTATYHTVEGLGSTPLAILLVVRSQMSKYAEMPEDAEKRRLEIVRQLEVLRTKSILASNGLGEPVAKISPINKPSARHDCKCKCRCKNSSST